MTTPDMPDWVQAQVSALRSRYDRRQTDNRKLPYSDPGPVVRTPKSVPQAAATSLFAPAAELQFGSDASLAQEYWFRIRRHIGLLSLITVAGLSIGIVYSKMQTPQYRGRVLIEVQGLNDDFLNMKNVTPISGAQSAVTLDDIQTHIKIVESRPVLNRVVKRLGAQPGAASLDPKQIEDRLQVRAIGRTRMIEILYESPDPKAAAEVVNTLAKEYVDQVIESRLEMSQRTRQWINGQLADMRAKLAASESALQSYARQSGLLFISEKISVAEEQLRRLQEQLARAQADRFVAQSRYSTAQNSTAEAVAEPGADNSLREYEAKLADLSRQRAELATIYTPEYSMLERIDAQISVIESAIKSHREKLMARVRHQYEDSVEREKLFANSYTVQAQTVNEEGANAVQYSVLKREADSNRQLYDSMLQRMNEASVASALRASNVRIIDPAQPPIRPYRPSLLLNASMGLLGSFCFGLILVLMLEQDDGRVRRPGELSQYLGLTELGVIYSARKGDYRLDGVASQPKLRPMMTQGGRQHAQLAQSFRFVSTSVRFSDLRGAEPRVLVVTSPHEGEGKTTVATNMAISLAELYHRVLLIEGDLHKPRLHEVFDLENSRGLTDLLSRPSALPPLRLINAVQPTHVSGLSVLPAGPYVENPGKLLHSRDLMEVLAEARQHFDAVVIDTPPMLEIADARVWGRLADAVVLIVRAGKTTRQSALAAKQRLMDDGTAVLGTVLNDWNPKSHPDPYAR